MSKSWKLKDVLLVAVCAVLFGVIYLGCTYIGGILYGALTPVGMASLGYEPFYGIYFMAGAFGVYVMRKPGSGIISELLAAVLEDLGHVVPVALPADLQPVFSVFCFRIIVA